MLSLQEKKMPNINKRLPNTAASTPAIAPVPPVAPIDSDMEIRNFDVKLIKDNKIRTMTDISFNETSLKLVMLKVEMMMESYSLQRLSIVKSAIDKEQMENKAQMTPVAAPVVAPDLAPVPQIPQEVQESLARQTQRRNDDSIL